MPLSNKNNPQPERVRFRLIRSMVSSFKSNFLAGLVVIGPLGITAYLAYSIFVWIDGWIRPYISDLNIPGTDLALTAPGIGVVFSILLISILGLFTRRGLGSGILRFGELIVERMPLIRNVYSGLKHIFETLHSQRQSIFNTVGMVEYPRRGMWAVALLSMPARGEISEKVGDDKELIGVFIPTTPNPTSGYLLYVPKKEIIVLDMSVEDAAKLVISGGLVTPDNNGKIEQGEEPKKIPEVKTPEQQPHEVLNQ